VPGLTRREEPVQMRKPQKEQSEEKNKEEGAESKTSPAGGAGPATATGPHAKPSKKKSPLEQAMDAGDSVSNKQIKSGLKKLDLNDDETEAKLAVSLAKSLKEEKLSITQVSDALKKVAASQGIAARVLARTFSKLKVEEGDGEAGEEAVLKFIEQSKFDAVAELKVNKSGAEMNQFLKNYGLEFLKGGPDSEGVVEAALEEDQKPNEIIEAINGIVGKEEDISGCTRMVADHVAKKVFAKPDMKVLEEYAPVLARCIQGNPKAAVQICFALQGEWFQKKAAKGSILEAYQKINELKLVEHDQFVEWQTDRKDKTKGKQKVLLAVFRFLQELKAKNKPIEAEEQDGDEDKDEDEDQEEFDATPTFIN